MVSDTVQEWKKNSHQTSINILAWPIWHVLTQNVVHDEIARQYNSDTDDSINPRSHLETWKPNHVLMAVYSSFPLVLKKQSRVCFKLQLTATAIA